MPPSARSDYQSTSKKPTPPGKGDDSTSADPRIVASNATDDRIIKLSVIDSSKPDNTKVINVHHKVLCATSHFFKKATNPEWSQSRVDPDTIDLTDEPVEVVNAYAHWLYFQKLPVPDDDVAQAYDLLCRAYIFGEKVMDTKFKNTVIDAIVATQGQFNKYPSYQDMNIIYRGTMKGSPARRLMVDFCVDAAHGSNNQWEINIRWFNKELLVDAMLVMVQKRPSLKQLPWKGSAHTYHENESN